VNLYEWARKWNVPAEAVEDLRSGLGISEPQGESGGESEASLQTRVRLEASRKGLRLWRNNVGAAMDQNGNFIRYGLANESKKLNDSIKSSDLIGIRPVVIAGIRVGQFVAREMKPADWKYTGTPRERAQLNFIELVASMGGDAAFCNREGTL